MSKTKEKLFYRITVFSKRWRRLIKKLYCATIISAIIICGCLTGCGNTSREVPEDQVQYAVEDYLSFCSLNGSKTKYGSLELDEYSDMDFEAVHSWNKESNTDTVKLSISLDYAYGSLIAENTLIYEYNRSNDLWSLIRSDEWSEHAKYNPITIQLAEFSGGLTYNPGLYWLYNTDINLETYEATAEYGTNAYAYPVGHGWNDKLLPACMSGEGTFELQDTTCSVITAQGIEKGIPALKLIIEGEGCRLQLDLTVCGILYSTLDVIDEALLTYSW